MARLVGTIAIAILLIAKSATAGDFNSDYTALVGDLNADGKQDIYVRFNPKITMVPLDDLTIPIQTNRRTVADAILQKTTDGSTFTIISPLSASQLATARSWSSISSSVVLAHEDMNADGYQDLFIRYLDSDAGFSTTKDHILYAPEGMGDAPNKIVALTTMRETFLSQTYNWIQERNWFYANAPKITISGSASAWYPIAYTVTLGAPFACNWYDECTYNYGTNTDPETSAQYPNVYHWFGRYLPTGTPRVVADYSGFNANAVTFAVIFDQPINQTGTLSSNDRAAIKAILEGVFGGAQAFGGVFSSADVAFDEEEELPYTLISAIHNLILAGNARNLTPTSPFVNPLPGAWINKKNSVVNTWCTADGRFGYFRTDGRGMRPHWGVDLGSSSTVTVTTGTSTVAVANGKYFWHQNGDPRGLGNYISVEIGRYRFLYGHLSSSAFGPGRVAVMTGGATVGYVGRSGNINDATGGCVNGAQRKTHLHFAIRDSATGRYLNPSSVSANFVWDLEP